MQMHSNHSILATWLLAVPAALVAQGEPPRHQPRPTEPAITAADLRTRVYIFADDSMQGREAGTSGHLRATAYLARELSRLGLQPAGEGGTFFQDFALEVVRPRPSTVVAGGDTLRPGTDYLIAPPGPLPLVGAEFRHENTPVIYGGRLGQSNLISPDNAAGKLVLFLPADDGEDGWAFWSHLPFQMLQRYGRARGILVAALDAMPDGIRGYLGTAHVGLPDQAAPRPTIPLMWISRAAADRLLGGPVARAFPGTEGRVPVTALGGHQRGPTEAPARNVVALLPGRDPVLRHQYVAFGAHSDHEGIRPPAADHDSVRAFNTVVRPGGAEDMDRTASPPQLDTVRALLESLRRLRPPRPDSIMNGADDNASGSMALLEIAEYFAQNPPRRSLLFVWHTAEEKGLLGAMHFTDHPTVPRDSIVAHINLDMIGRGDADDLPGGGPDYLQLIGSRRLSTELGALVEEVNRAGNYGFVFDYTYDADGHPQQYYCRSDHYMYARYGIPVVFATTGNHRDYHMLTDEPQYLNYDKYARVTRFIAEVGKAVADRDRRPVVDGPVTGPRGQCRQ
jgi:hypothetical protein